MRDEATPEVHGNARGKYLRKNQKGLLNRNIKERKWITKESKEEKEGKKGKNFVILTQPYRNSNPPKEAYTTPIAPRREK